MRNYIFLIFLLLYSIFCYSQNRTCDCSAALSKDLKSKFENTEYRNFKNFLVEYFQSDEVHRKEMKSDKSFSWSSVTHAIVDALPLTNSTDLKYNESKAENSFNQIRQVYLKNHFITDEQFNQVLSEKMSIEQLEAYKACLNSCSMAAGVSYNIGGNQDDEFFIQVIFNSQVSGRSITLKDDAIYNNLEPINGFVFKKNLEIKDRATITQFFKRLDPMKAASFSFNTIEALNITPLTLLAKNSANSQTIPVGTIVASILDYNTFLNVNGFDINSASDMSKVIWIPCDGRKLNTSKYANFGIVPDLRGVFLRGINDYSVNYPGVSIVSEDRKNPENKNAGDFQNHQLEKHSHYYNGRSNAGYMSGAGQSHPQNGSQDLVSYTGGAETRPKNVTVYYYLKIN